MSKSCPWCSKSLETSFEDAVPHCPDYCEPPEACDGCGGAILVKPHGWYCPRCDTAFGYEAITKKLPDGALTHVYTGLIEEEPVRDGGFFPNARLARAGLDAYALCFGVDGWIQFMVEFGVSVETRQQHTMVMQVLASWLPELEVRNAEIAKLRAEVKKLTRERNRAQDDKVTARKRYVWEHQRNNYLEKQGQKENHRAYNLLAYLRMAADALDELGCGADDCAGREYALTDDAWTCASCTAVERLRRRIDNALILWPSVPGICGDCEELAEQCDRRRLATTRQRRVPSQELFPLREDDGS